MLNRFRFCGNSEWNKLLPQYLDFVQFLSSLVVFLEVVISFVMTDSADTVSLCNSDRHYNRSDVFRVM